MADQKKQQAQAGKSEGAETCDLLVRHGHVLTMDAKRTVYPDGAVAISGTRIVAVGPTAKVAGRFKSRRVIDAGGGLAFAQKPRAKLAIVRAGPRVYCLDRNAPAEQSVFSKIDHSHSALAECFEDAIVRDRASDH